MHKIIPSVRRISTPELPTVTPIGEAARTANDQELLNMGISHIGGDLYSCIHQEQTDDDGNWHPVQVHPGVEVSAGSLKDRYAALPAADKAKVMRAVVTRPLSQARQDAMAVARGTQAQALSLDGAVLDGVPVVDTPVQTEEVLHVALEDVQPGDVVESTNLFPHSWSGERH